MIILEHADDPMYRFGHQQAGGVVDPSSQTEDLGIALKPQNTVLPI